MSDYQVQFWGNMFPQRRGFLERCTPEPQISRICPGLTRVWAPRRVVYDDTDKDVERGRCWPQSFAASSQGNSSPTRCSIAVWLFVLPSCAPSFIFNRLYVWHHWPVRTGQDSGYMSYLQYMFQPRFTSDATCLIGTLVAENPVCFEPIELGQLLDGQVAIPKSNSR